MTKKKRRSLGYSPIEYDRGDRTNFDYISDLNGSGEGENSLDDPMEFDGYDDLFKQEPLPEPAPNVDSDPDPVFQLETESSTSPKMIVSYYLEEKLVNKIKSFGNLTEQSYSAIAATAFKQFLKSHGF